MAGGAIGGHDQALLEQGLTMDALGIVFEDIVLVDLAIGLYRRALTMAPTADERHLQGRDR